MIGRPELKYYEAGLDLGLSPDPAESFRLFQGLIRNEYGKLVEEYGLVRMDATDSLVSQQQLMRELVRPHLEGVARTSGAGLGDALKVAGLMGHYLGEGATTSAEDHS